MLLKIIDLVQMMELSKAVANTPIDLNVKLISRIHAMAVNIRPLLGVLFLTAFKL
jgi:hypothetical protein